MLLMCRHNRPSLLDIYLAGSKNSCGLKPDQQLADLAKDSPRRGLKSNISLQSQSFLRIMDVAQWYAISLGCVVTLPVAVRLVSATLKAKCGAFYIRKYLVLPRLFRGYNKLSRLDVFILLLFLGCNVLCLTININDVPEFTKRSGVISVVNLVPLSLGSHMNFLFSFSGLSLPTCARFHRWLGRIALCEGLIHVAAAIPRHKLNLHTTSDIGGLAVCISTRRQ
jgi:hypothetical protein